MTNQLPLPITKVVQDQLNPDAKQLLIETPRLLLRGAVASDVNGLHACFSDAIAMRYWSSLPHADLAATAAWIQTMTKSKRNGVTDFVIELKPEPGQQPTATSIGKVGVWAGNEIGFIIARNFWKRGLAQEAVTAVLDVIFGNLNPEGDNNLLGHVEATKLIRSTWETSPNAEPPSTWPPEDVVADVDPRNELSLQALARLGFEVYETKEKTFQIGDEWVDSVYLSLKQEAWFLRRNTMPK